MLSSVCEAVREALGFREVLIQLLDEGRRAAASGRGGGLGRRRRRSDCCSRAAADLAIVRPRLRGGGLLPRTARGGRATSRPEPDRLRVRLNGRGPLAWHHHWLVVPLFGADGAVRGVPGPTSRAVDCSQRAHPPGAADLRKPCDGGARRRDPAHGNSLPGRSRSADPPAEPARSDARATETPRRGRPPTRALVFLDVDNFKGGQRRPRPRAVGDRVLGRSGSLLAELVRSGDRAFRVGGDEFALLWAAGEQEARDVERRIIAAMMKRNIDPLLHADRPASESRRASGRKEPHELLRIADEAMYQAKRSGTRIEVAA